MPLSILGWRSNVCPHSHSSRGSQVGDGIAPPGRFGQTFSRSFANNDARTCSLSTSIYQVIVDQERVTQSCDESRSHALIVHSRARADVIGERCDVVRFYPRQHLMER